MSDRFAAARGDSIVINGGPVEVWVHGFSYDDTVLVADIEVRGANEAQLVKPLDVKFWIAMWVLSLGLVAVISMGVGC